MPDFGMFNGFIPLLNERPLTTPNDFEFEVEKRISKRKI